MAVTYDSLVAAIPVQLKAQNTDIEYALPNIINDAVEMIRPRINKDIYRVPLSGTVTAGSRTIDFSATAGWNNARLLIVSDGKRDRVIHRRGEDYAEALYAGHPKALPEVYAHRGLRSVDLYPHPKDGTTWRGLFNVFPVDLGPEQQTNLFTAECPLLLRYACFMQAALWLQDPAEVGTWAKAFEAQLETTNANLATQRRDEAAVRARTTDNVAGN